MEFDGDVISTISDFLFRKHVVEALYASTAMVLFYDWLLILPQEVEHIWNASWNWTKALYLLTRYIPFVTIASMLRDQFASDPTPESCKNALKVTYWLSLLGVDLAEIVLVVRTYVVWNNNRRIGIGLALLLVLCQIPNAIIAERFIRAVKFSYNPYPEIYRGCVVISTTKLVFVNWMIVIIMEGVVLALMIVSAFKTHRGHASNLLNAIYIDGARFFLCVFCVTLVNILITLLLPIDFIGVGSSIEIVLHSNLACRLTVGLREVGQLSRRKPETFEPSASHNSAIEFANMNRRGVLGENALMDLEAQAGPSRLRT